MAVTNKNKRIPSLDTPGKYPYVDFTQYRSGSWAREDSTPNNESIATGHRSGSFKELSSDGSVHNLYTNTRHSYVKGGETTTAEDNHHNKVGGSVVSQVTQDSHTEHGGGKTLAVANDNIHVAGGFQYSHGTSGISHSSTGDLTTDHNDGSSYHNIEGDHVKIIGGTRYEQIGAEYGVYTPNGNIDFHASGNIQFTCQNMTINASSSITLNTPIAQIFINSTMVLINHLSNNIFANAQNAVITLGNTSGTLLQGGGVVTIPSATVIG